jgi:MFS family permease
MGLLTSSFAAGQLIFLPLLARLVSDYSWRWAVVVITAIVILMIPVLLLLRDYPRDRGLKPYGAPPDFQDTPAPKLVNPFTHALSSLGDACASRARPTRAPHTKNRHILPSIRVISGCSR